MQKAEEVKKMSEAENISSEREAPKRQRRTLSSYMSVFDIMGESSMKQILTSLPFILFLLLLAFLHIANNHYAEQMVRRIGKAEQELKQYRWEYMTVSSKLMKASRQSEIAKRMEALGLNELRQVPNVLVVEKKKEKKKFF
jgi:hypothetical protein